MQIRSVFSSASAWQAAFSLLAVLMLASCSDATRTDSSTAPAPLLRPALDQLSQEQAMARKARVADVDYTLHLDLVSQPEAYQGTVVLEFQLTDGTLPLEVDFTGGTVERVTANGRDLQPDYNGFFLTLPAQALVAGSNSVTIDYSHPFSQDGTGLHRFVDPEDGRTYLYTYLWPYYANRLFPSFDQPNLKAGYELTVRAASDWQVISATSEQSVTPDNGSNLWRFPRSQRFSTYIFPLHAGPYQMWEDRAGDIPLRLFARQSLAGFVDAAEWMEFTRAGLDHYQRYFDLPYPFAKYDQLIVPDFLIGAMENVAAVTFSETYVDRGGTSRFSSQRRAQTILHEMAHMWFGDLVTKDWWNGLWLNESFATLMSAIAVSRATGFNDLWHDFYLTENLTAINADNSAWSHPIEIPVRSTDDFFDVFDAITYDKGASVLNQLSHYIGEENFRLGVSSYLKLHAWGNTKLEDFIGALSNQSGTDLSLWASDWLYAAGVNTVAARFDCEQGVVSQFSILQSAPASNPTLRDQRLQLALFSATDGDPVAATAVLPIVISGAETPVPEALGMACPELVLPNYQAWGYTEVGLDDTSMQTLATGDVLGRIQDPLLRSMFWTAIFEAPAQGRLEQTAMLDMLIDNLAQESNDRLIRQLLGQLVSSLNRMERLGPDSAGILATYTARAEQQLWDLMNSGVSSASTLNLQFDSFVSLARSEAALDRLEALLQNQLQIAGFKPGQSQRWNIIRRFSERNRSNARQWLDSELVLDPSDSGRRAAIAAEAALPDPIVKQAWIERILEQNDPLPLSHLRSAMASLFPPGQEALQLTLLPQLTADLGALAATRDNYYLQFYGTNLFQGVCNAEGLEMLRAAIADRDAVGTTLYKFIGENARQAGLCLAQKQQFGR